MFDNQVEIMEEKYFISVYEKDNKPVNYTPTKVGGFSGSLLS